MGLEGGIYLYHKMTPAPDLGHCWEVFEGFVDGLINNKKS